MIKTIYLRVWKVLLKKPFRLWGISLLSVLLTNLGMVLAGIPLLAIAIVLLLQLGMSRVYLRGYRGEENRVENLFDGFRADFGKKLAGSAWAELFKFLWSLIPVVGFVFCIIRGYEYAFVPYILMERPEVPPLEARKVSREETRGWKGMMFGADVLLGVLVGVVFLLLALLTAIPVIGFLFGLILFVYALACVAFLPLTYGLLHAAFYEEIRNGGLTGAAARGGTAGGGYVPSPAPDPYGSPNPYSSPEAPKASAAAAYCPSCGGPLEPGARFCPSCGAIVSAPPAAPDIPKD